MARTRMTPLRSAVVHIVNPLTRRFAGRMPGFGLLTYRGRTTGRLYRTPINVWPRDDEYVFALTYGSDVQWVKNVLAAGGCDIRVRGREVHLTDPELIVDPTLRLWPGPPLLRVIGRLGHVTEFLRMRVGRVA
jgi:deazaflavin-dependent oxidoreductase (nitroreductase family)